eukprot:jgi/Mesen1/5187/ME000258S04284
MAVCIVPRARVCMVGWKAPAFVVVIAALCLSLCLGSSVEDEEFEAMLKKPHEPRRSLWETAIDEHEQQSRDHVPWWQAVAPEDAGIPADQIDPAGGSGTASFRGLPSRKLMGGDPLAASIKRLGLKVPKLTDKSTSSANINGTFYIYDSVVPPASVDWRLTAASTVVKTQMQCGSCWAVAVADLVSMTWAISNGFGAKVAPPLKGDGSVPDAVLNLDMSPQQICDCAGGSIDCCAGGWPEQALSYVMANGGLAKIGDYPYFGKNMTVISGDEERREITGWELVPARDLTALKKALAFGPVLVLVNAAAPDFQSYTGGIYNGNCTNELDHAVLVVGYGSDPTAGPYLIIKNSWGSAWGENGYMRMAAIDGPGQCGVTSTSAIFPTYFPLAGDPCKDVFPPPCGAGTCYKQAYMKRNRARCGCPAGYVENVAGIARCLPASPCDANPNPCGGGNCTNGGDGSYTCKCPQGTIVGARADGAQTCVAGGNSGGVSTYTVVPTDTCDSIMAAYGLTSAVFLQYNLGLDCANLLPGTVVSVGTSNIQGGCASEYTTVAGDTCDSIAAANVLTLAALQALNPTLSCAALLEGQSVCVGGVTLGARTLSAVDCGMSYDVRKPNKFRKEEDVDKFGNGCDSCNYIVNKFNLDWTTFYMLNPGIKCNVALPATLSVCLATVGSPIAPRMKVDCTKTYRVQHGDNCPKIWGAAELTAAQFYLLNPGVRCSKPYLQVGQMVCIGGPQLDTSFSNAVPYTVTAGDTLVSIAAQFASRCGTYATPANVCNQNLLSDCSAPLVVGMSLQVPCQWPLGRSCGCTAGTRVCGADGDWYSSYCDAVCNYATPAKTTGCSSCQYACNDRCGAGQHPYNAPDYCPDPCPFPPWPPVSWDWFSGSACSFYYQACSSCCMGGWGYGSGNYWNCLGYCRQYKC